MKFEKFENMIQFFVNEYCKPRSTVLVIKPGTFISLFTSNFKFVNSEVIFLDSVWYQGIDIVNDLTILPFEDQTFDLVITLDKSDDIFRVIKTDGVVLVKDEIINATPIDNGHITIYLPQYSIAFLSPYLLTQSKFNFEVFTKEVTQVTKYKNLTLLPIDNKTFTNSLLQCHGIITAGGFETPAEALYLKKKLLSIPILNHFEQECNGAAMKKLGVTVIEKIDKNFNQVFTEWILADTTIDYKLTHSTEEIVNLLMQQIPYNQVA